MEELQDGRASAPRPGHAATTGGASGEVVESLVGNGGRAAAARRLASTGPTSTELNRLSELAARLLGSTSAQVSVISDVQDVVGGTGAAAVGARGPAEDSLCTVTASLGKPLVVPDAATDERVASLPPVASGSVGSYLGVPLVGSDGNTIGALCVFDSAPRSWSARDIGLLERLAPPVVAELELAALTAEYESGRVVWQLAVDAAGIGAFDWDLVSGELRWDERLLELFGLDRERFGGSIESFNASVHPEDRVRVTQALNTAVETCGEYVAEYRVLLPDAGIRWIAARGRALAGEDGAAVRVVGAAYDTTAVQDGEARVARVLEAMPSAFFHLDAEWRFGYVNSESERLLGLARDELVGRSIWELFPASVGTSFEAYYRRAVETGEPVSFDAYYPEPLDAWYEVRAWPTPDGLSVYFVDVTARHEVQQEVRRSAERSALLARVTAQLAETLEAEEAVSRLAPLVVPALGDWCVATLVDDSRAGVDRGLRDVGSWHADEALRPVVERYAEVRIGALTETAFLPRAMTSVEPIVVNADATAALCGVLAAGEPQELTRRLAPEAAAVIRLRGRNRTVGLLTVFRGAERAPFGDADLDTLKEVAARAGLALDNARLFAEQRDLAEGLQRSLLTAPPEPDHLEIVVRYEPAAEAAQVGGDWYDAFLQQHGATVLVIGDVVGHDTKAAAAMGQVRSLLRGIAVHSGEGPAELLCGVDRVMQTLQVDTTATAVVLRLEQSDEERAQGLTRVRWSNAGHPPPILISPGGHASLLQLAEHDLLLGLDPSLPREEGTITVERGSTVLLFTDGLVERREESFDEGLSRLKDALGELTAEELTLDEVCDRLLRRMRPERQDDDIALVAVRLHPEDRPRPPEAGPNRVPPDVA